MDSPTSFRTLDHSASKRLGYYTLNFRIFLPNIGMMDGTNRCLAIYLGKEIDSGKESRVSSTNLVNTLSKVYLNWRPNSERNLLEQIHLFWVQKAISDAMIDGDWNARFFHTCAVIRRKRNKIEGLKNSDGEWIWEQHNLRSLVANHFKNLFTAKTILGCM
ncbi:hypothetical protein V2J09_021095 [Rumex salicifolius]